MNTKMKIREYIKIVKLDDVIEMKGKMFRVDSLDLCPGISVIRLLEQPREVWPGEIVRSNGLYPGLEDELEIIIKKGNQNKPMTITNLVKKLLDKDTRTLIQAGFVSNDLQLTELGASTIIGLLFFERKEDLVKLAQEKIDEEKKSN